MKKLKFKKIDAFTKGPAPGNPAGYILLEKEGSLDEVGMQKIALELKGFVNEIGFVSKPDGQYHLRFYSSECEVAFCGHATIAIMYDLLSSGAASEEKEVPIHVKVGKLSVFNHIEEEDTVYIMAPAPHYFDCRLTVQQVADALSIDTAVIDDMMPLRLIDGGLVTLLAPIRSLDGCLSISPDYEKLRNFCLGNGIDIVHVSVKETRTASCRYRTRVFAPKFGYLEDPATGSGNAAFGYRLLEENRWDGDFMVEQGSILDNPSFVKLRKNETADGLRMLFGGCGTTRIEGFYCYHG
jgi:PhzF family phenazine biosynthesis protein